MSLFKTRWFWNQQSAKTLSKYNHDVFQGNCNLYWYSLLVHSYWYICIYFSTNTSRSKTEINWLILTAKDIMECSKGNNIQSFKTIAVWDGRINKHIIKSHFNVKLFNLLSKGISLMPYITICLAHWFNKSPHI